MNWSLNELEAEAKKAIRGAGLSWGLSEEGAKAVRWLAAHGVDPLPALDDVLARHDRKALAVAFSRNQAGRWQADLPICPIVLGAALCDLAYGISTQAFVAGPVAQPILLTAFAARAARLLKRPLRLDFGGDPIMLAESGDPVAGFAASGSSQAPDIRCELWTASLPYSQRWPASTSGIAVDAALVAQLSAYGHRTYVPASERSRREGAGAGLIDND